MDIRCSQKHFKEFSKLYDKNYHKYPQIENNDGRRIPSVTLNEDSSVKEPFIMVKDITNRLVEWSRGYDNVKSFLQYGFVRIQKQCPFKKVFKKCSGDKCQLFLIENMTGDCSINWSFYK